MGRGGSPGGERSFGAHANTLACHGAPRGVPSKVVNSMYVSSRLLSGK